MSLGVKYILIAGFFFGIVNTMVKFYSHIPAIEIIFFRSIVTFFISYAYIRKHKVKILNEHFSLLLLRGSAGAIALILYFTTIQNMPLASAVTILYLAPIFTVIISIFALKEKPRLLQWPFILMSFSGAVVIKSFDSRIELKYFLMGITAAILAAVAYTTIRLLRGKAHPQLVIFFFPLVTLPICTPMMLKTWVTPSLADLAGLLSIGLATQIAQVYLTKAHMHSPAKKISHYNYITTIYALLCGVFFFNEAITYSSIIGLILIITGVILSTKFSKDH